MEEVEQVESMVRVYKNPKAYQKDASKLAKDQWQSDSVTERKPRAGIGRILSLGFFTLLFPPKPELVVTYTKRTLNKRFVRCFSCGRILKKVRGGTVCSGCGTDLGK